MKKNKDGFVEFPSTQVIGNQNNSTKAELTAGSEQHRKVQVHPKKRADKLSADVVMLGEKIILKLRLWFCFFFKFPIGIDMVPVECLNGEKIYCVRKWVNGAEQFYLVIDKQYISEEHFSYDLRYFLAQLLMSDICTFKGKSKRDFYDIFAAFSEEGRFADEDDEDADELDKFPGWDIYIYECAENYLRDVGLKIFVDNLSEFSELAGDKYTLNGFYSSERWIADIVQDLPMDFFHIPLLEDLLRSAKNEVSFHPERLVEPKNDILEKLLWVEALKADADTPEMMLPKKTDWIFMDTPVDEDGFPLNGSFYPSKK